ncbi:MAG: mycofactocin biosynthesis glycosyltransferase MftF [Firmicutes bacterium]|nr:mycofactocin biosynthesis glycosyltransferase MftF [Bacillota bacterium]
MYLLADGVTFRESLGNGGGTLTVRYPYRIIRLSRAGAKAIQLLCGPGDTKFTWDEKLAAFAAGLEDQGILTRSFPTLSDDRLPWVSIIIPTYNRPQMLDKCIESLIALDYPREKYEIIVVDDASPVPVDLGRYSRSVRLIRLARNGGPGAARNEAVRQAKGEIIAFLDDDCLAEKNWLRSLAPCFQYTDVAAAGGRVESAGLIRPLEKYEQVQSPLLMGNTLRKVRKGSSVSYLPTCNLLVRKRSVLAAGAFDPLMRVFLRSIVCWQILEKGEHIYYVPEGLVFHHHRSTLSPFLKRRYNYGQSEAKLQVRYPTEKRRLVFFPGNHAVFGITALISLTAGAGAGLAACVALVLANLVWQSLSKLHGIKAGECKPKFRQVFLATARSQGAAFYIYGQHYSHYYSGILTFLALFVSPGLALLLFGLHALPGIVDYKLKKPAMRVARFCFYHFLENAFYQAGVISGCLSEHNWRPMAMDFIRADANLLQRLAAKNQINN